MIPEGVAASLWNEHLLRANHAEDVCVAFLPRSEPADHYGVVYARHFVLSTACRSAEYAASAYLGPTFSDLGRER